MTSLRLKKSRELETMFQDAFFTGIPRYNKNCWFLVKKSSCQQNLRDVSVRYIYIYFWSSLGKV